MLTFAVVLILFALGYLLHTHRKHRYYEVQLRDAFTGRPLGLTRRDWKRWERVRASGNPKLIENEAESIRERKALLLGVYEHCDAGEET